MATDTNPARTRTCWLRDLGRSPTKLKSEAAALSAQATRIRREIQLMPRDADLAEHHAKLEDLDSRALSMRKEALRIEREASGYAPMDEYERALAASYAKDG